jgi:hypothetical protein
VYLTIPMLDPCTVTDAEPVPARFPRRVLLILIVSTDQALVTLPIRCPTVITDRRVPPAPCPTRHLTDVSDPHSVNSHAVLPYRARPVYVTMPMLVPCTVIDADPVPAPFDPRIRLTLPASTLQPCVALSPRPPTVITERRVPEAPWPTLHLTDVSDCQSVPSHPVCPVRPRTVYITIPMLDPCTVIDAEPVPARFPRRVLLILVVSTDQAFVTLPIRCPTVITDRRVPPAPCPSRHLTDVSEAQSVDSHPVVEYRARPVYVTMPMLAPCTVIDADPVPARFDPRMRITLSASTLHPRVALALRPPTVITTRRVPAAPCPT